ncbi:hypothetical protein ACH4MG_27180 [Streptomyces sp. NPDC017454]|uniref:hypothetical protein n=1 Tax=Streptomyces sp. NPDC017454 TaxID=3364997 RepID=UPI0037A75377
MARWDCRNGNIVYLCNKCLDHWFDNADDDPDLEPVHWRWLNHLGAQPVVSLVIHADPPLIAEAIRDIRRHGRPAHRR